MSDTGRLTAAQRRAREWLPADGSWRTHAGRVAQALSSLSFAWPGCVETEWGKFGVRGGEGYRWRFTTKGVEVNKAQSNPALG